MYRKLFNHYSTMEHVGCFQFLMIINNNALISFLICKFLAASFIPRYGISNLKDMNMF